MIYDIDNVLRTEVITRDYDIIPDDLTGKGIDECMRCIMCDKNHARVYNYLGYAAHLRLLAYFNSIESYTGHRLTAYWSKDEYYITDERGGTVYRVRCAWLDRSEA